MTEDPLARVAALEGVAEAAAAARAAVDRLLAHRVLRRRSADVSVEAGLRCARASAALEGVDLPLETLRREGSPDPVVQGALRVSAALGSLREVLPRAPLQALARLHVLAAADLPAPGELGQPRGPGQQPVDGSGPDPVEVSARLDGLVRVLSTPTSAPAAVVAAVTHGELLALRPFHNGNGLVARAAARLVLVARGLDPKALTAPDVGHVELRHEYGQAHSAYVAGGPVGVGRWVQHCCRALELGARESLAVCEALQRG